LIAHIGGDERLAIAGGITLGDYSQATEREIADCRR